MTASLPNPFESPAEEPVDSIVDAGDDTPRALGPQRPSGTGARVAREVGDAKGKPAARTPRAKGASASATSSSSTSKPRATPRKPAAPRTPRPAAKTPVAPGPPPPLPTNLAPPVDLVIPPRPPLPPVPPLPADLVAVSVQPDTRVPPPEPVVEPEPVIEPQPVADAEPEPVAEPKPEAIVEPEPEVIVEPEPEPVADGEPAVEADPIDAPEPVAEPERVAEAEPEPEPVAEAALVEPEPVVEPEPAVEAEPVVAPELVAEEPAIEPELVVEAEPEPFVEPEFVAAAEPEPIVDPATEARLETSTLVDVLEPESREPEAEAEAEAIVPAAVVIEPGARGDIDAEVPALSLRGVTKIFGDTRAVDAIDLTVPTGSFYGLVGPNGAGKTTTLSMIAGLLRPDAGTISIGGIDPSKKSSATKRLMGVLPDRLRTFDRLTGRQLLYYYGVLRGLPSAVVETRTADLARAFDLVGALGRPVSDYSAGMTKKVMLAGAMIHSPRLLVLDEPFEAVDPVSSAVILDILSTYVEHGGTVILSSHGMELVERVCSRVAVIVAGQVLAEGTVDEVRGESTLEQRFLELAGGLGDLEGLEWLHTFSD